MRSVFSATIVLSLACSPPPTVRDAGLQDAGAVDSGVPDAGDPGFGIPPEEWVDAGGFNAVGCTDGAQHFIFVFDSTQTADPWCAAIDVHATDAGSLFASSFSMPDGYAITDARFSTGCKELVVEGIRLDDSLRPVHGLVGGMTFRNYVNGLPRAFDGEMHLRIDRNVYSDVEGGWGMHTVCSADFP